MLEGHGQNCFRTMDSGLLSPDPRVTAGANMADTHTLVTGLGLN